MPKGGLRKGAGRPEGSGKFGQPTKAIRVPEHAVETIMRFVQNKFFRLPFYDFAVSAGFPSPAENELASDLDLNEYLIKHPAATFFLRVTGSSMIKAGIHHNDILIVDRSISPAHKKIVIASLNGELTVKRLFKEGNKVQLVAENDNYLPLVITEGADLVIWGVVVHVIHSL